MILSIQYLRAVAALMVLVHHVAWKLEQHGTNLLGGFRVGEAGVDVFFVVSGFIMCHTIRGGGAPVRGFLLKRCLRILPLYWTLTTVALLVFLIAPDKVNSSGGTTHIVSSYLLLPTDGKYLVQVGWTLGYEFYFYVLFAAGLWLWPQRQRAVVTSALVLLGGLGLLLHSTNFVATFLTSDLLLEFAAGMLLYSAHERRATVPTAVAAVMVAAACALFAGANTDVDLHWPTSVRALNLGAPACLLVAAFVLVQARVTGFAHGLLQRIGDSSYSLYLSHVFVMGAFAQVLGHTTPSTARDLLLLPVMLVVAVGCGNACYRWLEQPLGRALRRSRPGPDGAAALPPIANRPAET